MHRQSELATEAGRRKKHKTPLPTDVPCAICSEVCVCVCACVVLILLFPICLVLSLLMSFSSALISCPHIQFSSFFRISLLPDLLFLALYTIFLFLFCTGLSERQRRSRAALLPCFSPGLFPRVVPRNAPHQSRLPHLSTSRFSFGAPSPPTPNRSLPSAPPPPTAISGSRSQGGGRWALQPPVQV